MILLNKYFSFHLYVDIYARPNDVGTGCVSTGCVGTGCVGTCCVGTGCELDPQWFFSYLSGYTCMSSYLRSTSVTVIIENVFIFEICNVNII